MDREHTYRQSCPFLSPGGLPFAGAAFVGFTPWRDSAVSGITSTN